MLDESMLIDLVKQLTKNYGESHNYVHASKVANNARRILNELWDSEDIAKLRDEGRYH